jgi:hypothetical protein
MSYAQSFGQYFGLFGGDLEEVNKGKRRTVLWLTFVTWLILIGSTAGPDWILGGLEFGTDNPGQTAGQAHFHVNLNTVLIEVCVWDLYLSLLLYTGFGFCLPPTRNTPPFSYPTPSQHRTGTA